MQEADSYPFESASFIFSTFIVLLNKSRRNKLFLIGIVSICVRYICIVIVKEGK